MPSMMGFSSVRLEEGKAKVTGPMHEGLSGIQRITFALAQPDVMVEGEGSWGAEPSSWLGEAPADGLEPGPAFAFGVATFISGDPRGSQTFTWFEQVSVS